MTRLTKKELEEENEALRAGLEEAHETLSATLGYEDGDDENESAEEEEENDD